eukprot:ANDGO_00500.mRNA.1 hypothetical protein
MLVDIPLNDDADAADPIVICASRLCIPRSKFTLIAKGGKKISTKREFFEQCRATPLQGPPLVFLGVGIPEEDDTGCDPRDIEVLVRQCNIDRNDAIRTLRKNDQDLVSAILDIGNR